MNRFGILLTTLAACTYSSAEDSATFHGTVGQSVTHVMAVSPVAGDLQKVVAPVDGGAFEIAVTPGRPWTLVFVDATKRGTEMVGGVLRSDTLDTFLPAKPGAVDLGHVSIDGRDATMAGSSETLDDALGLSRRTLATIGGVDDLAVRYANPDIDGDGVLDIEQGHAARLEMFLEYELTAQGRPATADDLVAAVDIGYDHVGTGIYARLPEKFGKVDRDHASVTFDQPYWGYELGPFTPAIAAGVPVTNLTFGDAQTFGVYARPDHPIPSGNYRFRSGERTLDFTMVRPPTEMTMHQVMPLVRFAPTTPGCIEDCTIAAVEFAWRRHTDAGWVQLTDEEAKALEPRGALDLIAADGLQRRFEFPLGIPSGSLPWHAEIYSVVPTMSTKNISWLQVTFQNRQGIKMHASLGTGNVVSQQRPDTDGLPRR